MKDVDRFAPAWHRCAEDLNRAVHSAQKPGPDEYQLYGGQLLSRRCKGRKPAPFDIRDIFLRLRFKIFHLDDSPLSRRYRESGNGKPFTVRVFRCWPSFFGSG